MTVPGLVPAVPAVPAAPGLAAVGAAFGYRGAPVVVDLHLAPPPGRITALVGANACGKSTALRGFARLLRPLAGRVLLDGVPLSSIPTREVARRVALLPQQPIAPEGIEVAELVGRGRYPHQGLVRSWSAADEAAVREALVATGTAELAQRRVEELSGGQRQRVWIAMALAQQTDILLLDEPTTYLDIAHQVEVLDLLHELNAARGTTVVMVLHELNLAARYAHHLVAMRAGRVVAEGPPERIVTSELVREVFGLQSTVMVDPVTATPMVVPIGRAHRGPR